MMTLPDRTELDNSPIFRRIIQAVCDLARQPLSDLHVLDLASAHGAYSIELASRGAQVLGIEGREEWLKQARSTKQNRSLCNVEFVQDDVRNLSREKYGEFDVVLCLGILYHLDAPDVFEFLGRVSEVCRDFAVFETHVADAPAVSHTWRGQTYYGIFTPEHPAGASDADKLRNVGASLDNERSFQFTTASLCNILRDVGFTSVHECLNPMAYMAVGEERAIKIWRNRVTLAAIKGRPVSLSSVLPELPWPENREEHAFERFLYERAGDGAKARSVPRRLLSRLKRLVTT